MATKKRTETHAQTQDNEPKCIVNGKTIDL